MDTVEERIARLEERVAGMSASLDKMSAALCEPKTIGGLVKEPHTMIVILAVWLASAGGQSFQHVIGVWSSAP